MRDRIQVQSGGRTLGATDVIRLLRDVGDLDTMVSVDFGVPISLADFFERYLPIRDDGEPDDSDGEDQRITIREAMDAQMIWVAPNGEMLCIHRVTQ